MSELETWVCVGLVVIIAGMIWLIGKPWLSQSHFWSHKCPRMRCIEIDLPDDQHCPWCGESERHK